QRPEGVRRGRPVAPEGFGPRPEECRGHEGAGAGVHRERAVRRGGPVAREGPRARTGRRRGAQPAAARPQPREALPGGGRGGGTGPPRRPGGGMAPRPLQRRLCHGAGRLRLRRRRRAGLGGTGPPEEAGVRLAGRRIEGLRGGGPKTRGRVSGRTAPRAAGRRGLPRRPRPEGARRTAGGRARGMVDILARGPAATRKVEPAAEVARLQRMRVPPVRCGAIFWPGVWPGIGTYSNGGTSSDGTTSSPLAAPTRSSLPMNSTLLRAGITAGRPLTR